VPPPAVLVVVGRWEHHRIRHFDLLEDALPVHPHPELPPTVIVLDLARDCVEARGRGLVILVDVREYPIGIFHRRGSRRVAVAVAVAVVAVGVGRRRRRTGIDDDANRRQMRQQQQQQQQHRRRRRRDGHECRGGGGAPARPPSPPRDDRRHGWMSCVILSRAAPVCHPHCAH